MANSATLPALNPSARVVSGREYTPSPPSAVHPSGYPWISGAITVRPRGRYTPARALHVAKRCPASRRAAGWRPAPKASAIGRLRRVIASGAWPQTRAACPLPLAPRAGGGGRRPRVLYPLPLPAPVGGEGFLTVLLASPSRLWRRGIHAGGERWASCPPRRIQKRGGRGPPLRSPPLWNLPLVVLWFSSRCALVVPPHLQSNS